MSSGEMNRIIVDFARPARLIATVLAVVLHCTFARAQTQNDHLIVPWQRIGPMSVGMSAADLIHSMARLPAGNPVKSSPINGPVCGRPLPRWLVDDADLHV